MPAAKQPLPLTPSELSAVLELVAHAEKDAKALLARPTPQETIVVVTYARSGLAKLRDQHNHLTKKAAKSKALALKAKNARSNKIVTVDDHSGTESP